MGEWSDIEDQDAYAVDVAEAAAWVAEHPNPVQTALGRVQAEKAETARLRAGIEKVIKATELGAENPVDLLKDLLEQEGR
mgnify:CR=1 FL=1